MLLYSTHFSCYNRNSSSKISMPTAFMPSSDGILIYQLEKNYNLRKKHSSRECYNKHFPQENIAIFLAATVGTIS